MPRLGNAKRTGRGDEREIVSRVEGKPVLFECVPESLGPKPDGRKGHVFIEQHDVLRAPGQNGVGREADPRVIVGRVKIDTQFGELAADERSEEHTSEPQSLMRISYAVFCVKKKKKIKTHIHMT